MADFKITRNDELMHYRTKGSRNGVRLYQNPDGSLTPLGERHYREMYGYGEHDGGVSKSIDANLQRARPGQTLRTASTSVDQKSSARGILKKPSTSREYNQEMLYNSLRNSRLRNAGGNDRVNNSSRPSNPSSEYLKELNYNSKKNEYFPSNSSQISPQEKRGTPGTAGKPLSSNAWRFGLTDFDVYGQGQQPENVSKKESELKKAYDSATNWVVERADDVKKGVTDAAVKVGDAAKNAYNDASKWVVDRADDVKKGATDAYNKASDAAVKVGDAAKWVVDRADDVKKGAADAYDSASKAVADTADKVKKGAEDVYNTASKAVSDTADKVKKGVSDAYDATSKAVVDAADEARYASERAYNSAKNAVTDVVDRVKNTYGPGVADVARVISELPKNLNDPHLKEGLDNSYNAVKEWVTTAADDVKKTASEAFDAGKEWVEQAGKDVGDFVNNAVSDVTKAVDDAKKGVTDAANSVGKAAQDGWNWVKGLFGGGKDDYGKDEDKDRSNHSSSSHKM